VCHSLSSTRSGDIIEYRSRAYLSRVPAGDGSGGTDVREAGNGTLSLPAVSGDETVGTVGAGDGSHGAAGIIVASVVGDCDVIVSNGYYARLYPLNGHTSIGHGNGGESEDAGDLGEEHFG
jgi:hypothetical protein